ncbi:alpha/beta hydrolase [Mycolicibacillus parakoreensis]|uniref:Alpha/beta hydrolase n=1 Tax=Mycolicibacillus parakoreensis TaxID=1069221 RepID=A0ABY3TVY5_9MYCO|nr:alpha/beta hydrolase [Mycolicibacillus parakoreensis]MCV7315677.1 alpha/beta hydrolase [Mycolicibacillus parakoreensis]ULN51884.1 alpha/beta hydrolase [Mycolicibacillus parakoreensis]
MSAQPPTAPVWSPEVLGRGRPVIVRACDGTRLHTEVFGPPDGYPVVLSHGFVCALRVWAHQITDLCGDYRVIAFDHRGHGRSGVPKRGGYSLNHLAADLDSVLEATLAPGERAVIAGHSLGGITISAWAKRYPHRVERVADAVALINTTTGELVDHIDLLPFPRRFAPTRTLAATNLIRLFGGFPVPGLLGLPLRPLVQMMAVGALADPTIADFIYELFERTPPAGRGGLARALVTEMGPRYVNLADLTVPALVIGSERDRLTPIGQSRRIAAEVPELFRLVELPGGHCSILEHPDRVNAELRGLIEAVAGRCTAREVSS